MFLENNGDLFSDVIRTICDWENIFNNGFIFVAAIVTVLVGIVVIWLWKKLSIQKIKEEKNNSKKVLYGSCESLYSLFTVLISIFPLLGMLGTVVSLLTLDMSEDTIGMQENFFSALTSTEYGIVFSIFFKVVNSFIQPHIENLLEDTRKKLYSTGDENEPEKT